VDDEPNLLKLVFVSFS